MSYPPSPVERAFESLRNSSLLQLLAISGLILVLQIPIAMISELVRDREQTRTEAIASITATRGGEQAVVGPFLLVPYTGLRLENLNDGTVLQREYRAWATFLPRTLTIDGNLDVTMLHRGIFDAPVYESQFSLQGSFDPPDFSDWSVEPERIAWDQAQLVFTVSGARSIQNLAKLTWQGQPVDFSPGVGAFGGEWGGIHAALPDLAGQETLEFSTELDLNGSVSARFAPLGQETTVALRSNWPAPSFQGAYLPRERAVEANGFAAQWTIPYLGRNFPQRWCGGAMSELIDQSLFGVDLLTPVDAYRQTERSLKYQVLFLGLTFITIWLFELLGGARVHWIQYGFIGAAMCLFYLLELSLAEHLGFGAAYSAASSAVVAMVALYGRSALRSGARAAGLGAMVAALYGCLFVLIRLEDFALLVGSLALFAVLAVIMYATRNVDWYAPRGRAQPSA